MTDALPKALRIQIAREADHRFPFLNR